MAFHASPLHSPEVVNIPDPSARFRSLDVARHAGYVAFGGALFVLGLVLCHLAAAPDRISAYLISLVVVVAILHGGPALSTFLDKRSGVEVGPDGDGWRIGRYSEAELRDILGSILEKLPRSRRRVVLRVVDDKESNAWTFLAWSIGSRKKVIQVTSGSLHYLDREELAAELHHEMGHHLSPNRVAPPGGWLIFDLALHGTLYAIWAVPISPKLFGLLILTALLFRRFGFSIDLRMSRLIEHRCDLFAARRMGPAPMINALLKMGEEIELTTAVIMRLGRRYDLDSEDLATAFNEVRPYGRIFHGSLFRHSAEAARELGEPPTRHAQRITDASLARLHRRRKRGRGPRIRWRRFDRDGDGRLDAAEIDALTHVLEAHPKRLLFVSETELSPSTHPSFRERVLFIQQCSRVTRDE